MNDKTRLTIRVPSHIASKLIEAANLTGVVVNQFVIQAALEKAENIAKSTVNISKEDNDLFINLLGNPTKPNEALLKAFERHSKD